MTRRYGRCPRGQRLVSSVPWGHWKTTTFVAALRLDEMIAPCALDGPMDGDCFRAYIEQFVVPTLRRGDIVIMDNLASHKVAGIDRLSRPPEPNCDTCPPIAPISIRSNRLLPSLKLCCERPPQEPSTISSKQSPTH